MSNQQPTVLIAEDSPDDYSLLELAFREAGHTGTLEWVRDGDAVLARLVTADSGGTAPYSLIVLDYYLPRKNSVEILAELAAAKWMPSCPIVILTTLIPAEERDTLMATGVRVVFEKPSDLDGYTALGYKLIELFSPQ